MPRQAENLLAAKQMLATGYKGRIAATARFPDEIAELQQAGVHSAFNIYAEAGVGFAEHVSAQLKT